MRTREVTIKRHQAFIDIDRTMPLDELIRKLESAREMAAAGQRGTMVVGFPDSLLADIFGPKSLIVQWDETVPDEPTEEETTP